MLNKLQEEPFIPNPERGGDKDQELIDTSLLITSTQAIGYWSFALLTVISTVCYALSKRITNSDSHAWQLPYGPFSVVNVTYSPNFEIIFLYQNFAIVVIIVNFTTVDLIMVAVLVHVTFQFRILQNNIRRIVNTARTKMVKDKKSSICVKEQLSEFEFSHSTISWRYLQNALERTVNYHLAILSLAEELEAVFNQLLLFVFLGMLGVICFLIYYASKMKDAVLLVQRLTEIMSAICEVALVCFWGEQVLHESQEVGRTTFGLNFAGTDLRFQRGLTLIIQRSQRPTSLTAGKFVNVTLTTFVWVLRTAYSSFMVLRSSSS